MILWLEGQGSVGVDVGSTVRLRATTYAHIVGECFGDQVSGCVFVNNRGGQFAPDGQVHCWHHEGCVDVVDAGDAHTIYGGHVLGDSFTRTSVRATALGRRDDNDNPTHAGFGFSHDQDEDTARAWGYAGPAASKVFAVSARPFASDPAASFDAEAATRFGVRADGGLVLDRPAVEAAAPLGDLARRVPAYDRTGNLLGYVPLYAPGT